MDHQQELCEETIEIARDTMHGDLMRVIVDELRAAQDVWDRLPENKQQEAIARIEQRVGAIIADCVQIIATDAQPAIGATLKEVVFKEGIKAVLSLAKGSEQRHRLADATGAGVYIVVPGVSRYGGGVRPKATPNQGALPLEEAQAEQAFGAAMEEEAQAQVDAAGAVHAASGITRPFVITKFVGGDAFGVWAINADDAWRVFEGRIVGVGKRDEYSISPGEKAHLDVIGCINPMDSPSREDRAQQVVGDDLEQGDQKVGYDVGLEAEVVDDEEPPVNESAAA